MNEFITHTLTTLTPVQWRVLTFIQEHQRKWHVDAKLQDIRHGSGMASGQVTLDVLRELGDFGLVRLRARRKDGRTYWSARLLNDGDRAVVGVAP